MLSIGTGLVSLALLFILFTRYVRHRSDPARKIQCAVREFTIPNFLSAQAFIQPVGDAHWLWGHEYIEWKNEIGKMYSKWAMAVGPVYRIKAALFKRDVVSILRDYSFNSLNVIVDCCHR